MCNECKKEIKYLKDLIGVDGEDFLESHGFSTILQALSYLLTKMDEPHARTGAVRPRDGHFEPVNAVSSRSIPAALPGDGTITLEIDGRVIENKYETILSEEGNYRLKLDRRDLGPAPHFDYHPGVLSTNGGNDDQNIAPGEAA
jgi:hypothetical protein